MQSGKGIGILSVVLVLRPQLAQPCFPPLRDRGLRDQPAEEKLAGKIEPMRRKRIDDVAPDLLFESVQTCWRLRAALPGHKRHD